MVSENLQYTLAKEIVRGALKKETVRQVFFENDAIGWREFQLKYLNDVDYLYRRQLLLTNISYYAKLARRDAHMLRELSRELDRCTQAINNLKRDADLDAELERYKDDPKLQARLKKTYAKIDQDYRESIANKKFIQSGLQKEVDQLTTSVERYEKQLAEGDGLLLLNIIGVL